MAKTFRLQPVKRVDTESVNRLVWKLNEEFDRIARAIDDVLAGRSVFTGDIDLGGFRATNAATPEASDDLVTLDSLEGEVDKLFRQWASRQTSEGEDGVGGSGGGTTSGGGKKWRDAIDELLDNLTDTGVVFARTAGGTVELATDSTNFNWTDATDLLGVNAINVLSAGAEATPSLYLASDADTGLWHPAADTLAASTGGAERFRLNTTEFVHNEDGDDYDFRVESDTLTHALFVDGATGYVAMEGAVVAGANAAPTNASVGLEVQSTTKAFLLPRMTTAQILALTPLEGMLVYSSSLGIMLGYVDGVWAPAGNEIPMTSRIPVGSVTIPQDYCATSVGDLEIAAGERLTLLTNSVFEIL